MHNDSPLLSGDTSGPPSTAEASPHSIAVGMQADAWLAVYRELSRLDPQFYSRPVEPNSGRERALASIRALAALSEAPSAPVAVQALVASLRECELFVRALGLESEIARKVAEDARAALAAHAQQPATVDEADKGGDA